MIEIIKVDGLSVLRALPGGAPRGNVLFVHGFWAEANVWNEWLPFFAERGWAAHAVNLRGRPGSKPVRSLGRVSVLDYADDAGAIARWLGKPMIVGHSMGGLIAQRLAAADAVRAAALVTPAPPRGIPLVVPSLLLEQLKYLPAILFSRPMSPDREDLRHSVMNCVPPAEQDLFLSRLVVDSGRAAREMSLTGVPVDASRVRCPVRVYTASDDRFIPPRIVKRIARRYGVEAEPLDGHGHMVIVEPGWQRLAETIARWFNDR